MIESIISFENLAIGYNGQPILSGISLSIARGSFTAIMRQFVLLASAVGGAASFIGFCIAYRFDLPVGPTDVVFLGIVYALAFLASKLFILVKRRPRDVARI
jgi:hypothetical protein